MKYIEKPLVNRQGFEPTFWLATEGHFNLQNDSASIVLFGWKDLAAWKAGAERSDIRSAEFKLSEMASFESVWTEIATRLVTAGDWAGGEIKDTDTTPETPTEPTT